MTITAILLQSSGKQKLHINSCQTSGCIKIAEQPVIHEVRTEIKSFTTPRKGNKAVD
jgi:hypothetical protein